jgi:S-adenosylmethionine:tRNA ribosyltransferase-isomerase
MSHLLSDYDYALPEERIARYPAGRRDASRLMVVHRKSGELESKIFPDFLHYLRPNDLLVLNTTAVFRARLRGSRRTGGKVEIFLLEEQRKNLWRTLTFSGRPLRPGVELVFDETKMWARVEEIQNDGSRLVSFHDADDVRDELPRIGHVPIPPYLRREDEPLDAERYQTVYAAEEGSVAAPTAGLHFTEEALKKIEAAGVHLLRGTLHVGRATFAPIHAEDVRRHAMEEEAYALPTETPRIIRDAKERGGRVVAVGTTSVRMLESWARTHARAGKTSLFVYPPFDFKIVDVLLTNFHLPKSSLLLLVSAFAQPGGAEGRKLVLRAYGKALEENFRFYSYGDACLFL